MQPRERYYSLVLAGDTQHVERPTASAVRWVLAPIRLPAYLDTRSIALQTAANRIESAHRHFWAEPLDEAIAKVLVSGVEHSLDSIAIEREAGRWTAASECRLRVEFDAFHPTRDGRVRVSGRYWISAGETMSRHSFDESDALEADGYAHVVDALRASLDSLSTQIAAALGGTTCE